MDGLADVASKNSNSNLVVGAQCSGYRRSVRSRNSCGGRAALLVVLAAAFLAGCSGPDNPYAPFPEASFDEYVSQVQPMLGPRCANLGCHGIQARNLSLFAVGYMRAAPSFSGTPLDEHRLSEEELSWNFDGMRLRLVGATSVEDSRLLLKLLDPEDGGIAHAEDVVVFDDLTAPDYLALEAWVGGAL